jgi:3-hydroxyacyl-[acyl-carrier-protein] dehydratase
MTRAAIEAAIPHRPPFLLLDEIVEQSQQRIVCRQTFRGDEFWYAGHYPGRPITPGVILCEAAMQAGAVLLAAEIAHSGGVPVVSKMSEVRFKRIVSPGETIDIEVTLDEKVGGAFFLSAKVTVEGQLAVRLQFVCMMVVES